MSVALVTDSTAYLPREPIERLRIGVVPIHVIVGGREYAEGVDVSPQDVAEALKNYTPVTTARPSPQAMLAAYEAAAEAGASSVVSVHLSADISSTLGSAQIAANEAPIPVEVVDSRSVAMGLGFAVLEGAQRAADGADLQEVVDGVRERAAASSVYFSVDTLEFLRRGGRIGTASKLLGAALAIKPILGIRDGVIVPLERVRTTSRAVARLEDLVLRAVADASELGRGSDVAVHHVAAPERAEALAERLRTGLDQGAHVAVTEVGAVVGAHVGPGTLGAVVSPRTVDGAAGVGA